MAYSSRGAGGDAITEEGVGVCEGYASGGNFPPGVTEHAERTGTAAARYSTACRLHVQEETQSCHGQPLFIKQHHGETLSDCYTDVCQRGWIPQGQIETNYQERP